MSDDDDEGPQDDAVAVEGEESVRKGPEVGGGEEDEDGDEEGEEELGFAAAKTQLVFDT